MLKLIKTNIVYLTFRWKFLIAAAAMLYVGIRGGMVSAEYGFSIEHPLFAVLITAALTLFTAGRENTDGTLRSKLVIGYSRGEVFGSFLISSVICSMALYLIFSLPYFIIGKELYGKYMSSGMIILISLIILCCIIAVTAGSVCLALCVPLMPVAAVLLLAAGIGFIMLNQGLYRKLKESRLDYYTVEYPDPSMAENTDKYPVEHYDADGTTVYYQILDQPNPDYVSGLKRDIYRFLFYVDPYSQIGNLDFIANNFINTDYSRMLEEAKASDDTDIEELQFDIYFMMPYYPLYTLGLTAVLIIAGLIVFRIRNVN